jgi:hypothetical protein
VDEKVLTSRFIVDWNDKNVRLDKDSGLYDKKAEKKFRDLLEAFVNWLKNAEEESGSE